MYTYTYTYTYVYSATFQVPFEGTQLHTRPYTAGL